MKIQENGILARYLIFCWIALLFCLAAIQGCGDPAAPPDYQRRRAHIWLHDEAVFVPDTVTANLPFEILFLSTLRSCDNISTDRIINTSSNEINVFLTDSIYVGPNSCSSEGFQGEHRLQFNFSTAGEAKLVLHYSIARPFGSDYEIDEIPVFVLPE